MKSAFCFGVSFIFFPQFTLFFLAFHSIRSFASHILSFFLSLWGKYIKVFCVFSLFSWVLCSCIVVAQTRRKQFGPHMARVQLSMKRGIWRMGKEEQVARVVCVMSLLAENPLQNLKVMAHLALSRVQFVLIKHFAMIFQ